MGLIGRPVGHSVGQMLYSRIFDILGINAAYLAVDTHPLALSRTVMAMRSHFTAFNVTIPHKAAILDLIDELDDAAEMTGSANLVTVNDNILKGFNTDYSALVESLREIGVRKYKKALVYGSGGTGRTTVAALRREFGCEDIYVASRNPETASSRLSGLQGHGLNIISYGDIVTLDQPDIVINCSPAGMSGLSIQASMLPEMQGNSFTVVDFVYTPSRTHLISWAESAGARVVTGDRIFLGQAAGTLKRVFGIEMAEGQLRKEYEISKELMFS